MRTKEADDDAFSTSKKRPLRKRAKAVPSFAAFSSFFSFLLLVVVFVLPFFLGENVTVRAEEEGSFERTSTAQKLSFTSSSESSFTLPLSVDVLLLGLDDTLGNDPYLQVDKSGLLLHLNEAFQKFSVLHNDMKEKNVIVPMKSKVRFTIQWTVKHGSVSLYEEKLGKLRRDYEDAVGTLKSRRTHRPRFIVDAKALEPVVERVIRGNNDEEIDSDGKFTVVICLPSATRIIYNSNGTSDMDTKEFSYTYGYDLKNVDMHEELRAPKKRHREYATSNAWVGSGKYAVVDLRAEGPPVKKGQKKSTWVFPTRHSIVEPFKEFLNTEEGVFESVRRNFDAHVYGELGKTIFDGVRSLHAPDIAFETMNFAKRVLCRLLR